MMHFTTDTPEVPQSSLSDVGLHEQITAIESLNGKQYFPVDKLEAHVKNIPHVAISIFVFDGEYLLLQKRAATKYHSAGLWANTVCSHPRWNESIEDCARRRLHEELGWQVPLKRFGSIDYKARVGELFENEHVHCFEGQHNSLHNVGEFNSTEVEAVQWLTIREILQQLSKHPETFTEWFKIYMTRHRQMIEALSH